MLVTVADAANRDGEHAHPGINAVCEGSLYGRRQAGVLLAELVAEGWLTIEEQGGGAGKATVYSLPRMATENCALSAQFVEEEPRTLDQEPRTLDAKTAHSEEKPRTPGPRTNGLSTDSSNGLEQQHLAPLDDVTRVFTAWSEAAGKPRSMLDPKRRTLIAKCLKSFPVDDLIDAVRGWRWSAWHCGENDRHTTYNDLGLLLRDAAHIEEFRDWERNVGRPATGPRLSKSQSNITSVFDRVKQQGSERKELRG